MDIPKHITAGYLRANPNLIFVFGDNLIRRGKGGAAKLRDEPNTYGFITKKYPNNMDGSFYRPEEYRIIFARELIKLTREIVDHPNNIYLITKLGAGLANRYHIYEHVIRPGLACFESFPNVILQANYNW